MSQFVFMDVRNVCMILYRKYFRGICYDEYIFKRKQIRPLLLDLLFEIAFKSEKRPSLDELLKEIRRVLNGEGDKFISEFLPSADVLERIFVPRNIEDEILQNAVKDLDETLWKKYFPNDRVSPAPESSEVFSWLNKDLIAIVLNSEKRPSLDELVKEIYHSEYGKEILLKLPIYEMRKEISTRSNWKNALYNVKKGSELSGIIGYSLNENDIRTLARLHKSNKFRRKIEELLTDCNFHEECYNFQSKKYAEYI